MSILFRRSASIAPAASRQTLDALLRLIPSESFSSSAFSPLDHVNGSPPTKKDKDFHFVALTMSSFGASDTACRDEMISKLNIDHRIVCNLRERGITKLSPIQRACFEPAMQGRDVIGQAKTGAGKTLAFGIPIMDKILRIWDTNGHPRNPLALVLAPTRELAKEVELEFRETAPLDTLCAFDGMLLKKQIQTLEFGIDAIFGTPKDIICLVDIGALHLENVQFVVLDEAVKMLSVGVVENDAAAVLNYVPSDRQSLVMSTTMPEPIKNLTQKYLKDPVTIKVEEQHTFQMRGGNFRTNKIYVGQLPPALTDEELKQYFQFYGNVTDVDIKYDQETQTDVDIEYDQETQRRSEFGFITFDNEDAVDRALHTTAHELNGKLVHVKRAAGDVQHGGGSGYMGSSGGGYGDVNGNSGYSNAWRSYPSQEGYGAGQDSGPPGEHAG